MWEFYKYSVWAQSHQPCQDDFPRPLMSPPSVGVHYAKDDHDDHDLRKTRKSFIAALGLQTFYTLQA